MAAFSQHGFMGGGAGNSPNPNGNLEDFSNATHKPLSLCQQTDQPTLRYNRVKGGGVISSGSASLMLTRQNRHPTVPLFSHSDIQYLRQQVQQYSTPPNMLSNVLFTSFAHKPAQTPPNSLYTHTITNSPVSNININIQSPPSQPYPPTSGVGTMPHNPYSCLISAQEFQPPDGHSSFGSILMQSSSNGSIRSVGSPGAPSTTSSAPYSGSSAVYRVASSGSGYQSNVFMKPQVPHTQSPMCVYKTEKRSTHSTISVKENKLGSVIYKPNCMTPPGTAIMAKVSRVMSTKETPVFTNLQPAGAPTDSATHTKQAQVIKPDNTVISTVIKSNSNSPVTVPHPPSRTKRAVLCANNVSFLVVSHPKAMKVTPEEYGFVTNIPNHPGPKGTAKQNGTSSVKDLRKIGESASGSDSESGKTESVGANGKRMNNVIAKSSIPRPGRAVRSCPRSSDKPENNPAVIRNLNYTPTKPYSEINNNTNFGSTDSLNNVSTSSEQQKCEHPKTKDSPDPKPPAVPSTGKIMFYHKTSKNEIVLHRPPLPRPKTEGSPTPPQHSDKDSTDSKKSSGTSHCGNNQQGIALRRNSISGDNEEWEDEDEEDDSTIQGERLPGDGDDFIDDNDNDDDDDEDDDDVGFEDDGIDGLDDDVGGESDEDASDLSRIGSSRSHMSTLRIRSATKRLLGLSIKNKTTVRGVVRATRSCPTTAHTRSVSAISTLSSTSDLLPALTPSLFPLIPPTINFVDVGEKVEQLPWEIRKLFKWRMSPITPNVIKNCISRSGFRVTKKNHDWLGYWGKHMKAQGFKAVLEYQKVNHFPGTFQIGRKDRLWRNLSRLQLQYGKKEFGFFPQTFVLPPDLRQLKRAFEDGGTKQKWIIKPPASARGIGIRVIHKWIQIPRKRAIIVQRYLSRPYLINDSKFDLRIYVYLTSYDPLRIYVYHDGLVRFASCKYSAAMKNLSNKYMHLTNYSINKKNEEYQSNSDDTVCQGHKWSLKALWGYMKKRGINTNAVWQSMLDLIVKTIISSESAVNSFIKANVRRRYSCNELFGFDIMLDDQLKPWIIEVNISPSLHSNSQLDLNVKGGMVKDLMNLAGFTIPGKNDITPAAGAPPEPGIKFIVPPEICVDPRLHPTSMATDEKAKHAYYCQRATDEEAQQTLLDILTPDDIRMLAETVDEDSRRGNFIRAFPNFTSHKYLRFFEQPRYYNLLLDAWTRRYHRTEARGIMLLERLCSQGLHLNHQTDDPKHMWGPPTSLLSCDLRGATSASAKHKAGHNTNLPKLKKRVVKPQSSATGSNCGGSSSASSTVSIAGNVVSPITTPALSRHSTNS